MASRLPNHNKIVLRNFQSPGDIICLSAAVRDLKLAYPDMEVSVDTSCMEIWQNNPRISQTMAGRKIDLGYPVINRSTGGAYNFIHGFRLDLQTKLGLPIPATKCCGEIFLSPAEKAQDPISPKPYILLMAGHKKDYTLKGWIPSRWQELINRFPDIQFIQAGATGDNHFQPDLKGNNLLSVVGKTNLRELILLHANAMGVICGNSVSQWICSALPPRLVICIAGGREPLEWIGFFPKQNFLHCNGLLKCSPCWKSRIVPLNDGSNKDNELCPYPVTLPTGDVTSKCMSLISVDMVAGLIQTYIDNNPQTAIEHGILFGDDWDILTRSLDLIKSDNPTLLENGVYEGKTSKAINRYLSGKQFKYYGVDPSPQPIAFTGNYIQGFSFKVDIPNELDWVFIDGCHCAECVARDFLIYSKKVKQGGVICFHDCNPAGQAQDSQDYENLKQYHNSAQAKKGIDVLAGIAKCDFSNFKLVLESNYATKERGGIKVFQKTDNNVIQVIQSLPHIEPSERTEDYVIAENMYPELNKLVKEFKPESICEIGVRKGFSAVAFLYDNPFVKKYVGYDIQNYVADSMTMARANIESLNHPASIDLIIADTQKMDMPLDKFDLIYVDGDHTTEGAYRDIVNFWGCLNVGGAMLIDDSIFYGNQVMDGIKRAETELGETGYNLCTFRGTYVLRKTH